MFDLAVITVRRDPAFVYQSLRSLLPEIDGRGTLHLWVGSDDASYLQHYQTNASVCVHGLSPEAWKGIQHWGVHRRFCFNYHRALAAHAQTGTAGLCLCEDDVLYRQGFVSMLQATIDEMENGHALREYVLAGYATCDFEQDKSLYRGEFYCSYPAEQFFGTQCVYYPASVLEEVQQRMLRDGVQRWIAPGDMVLRDYVIERQHLFACTRSLVQHIGSVSSGLGGFHQSPSFDRPFGPLPRF